MGVIRPLQNLEENTLGDAKKRGLLSARELRSVLSGVEHICSIWPHISAGTAQSPAAKYECGTRKRPTKRPYSFINAFLRAPAVRRRHAMVGSKAKTIQQAALNESYWRNCQDRN